MAARDNMTRTSAFGSLLLSEDISEPLVSRDCRKDCESDSGSNESDNMDNDNTEDELEMQIDSDPEVLDDDENNENEQGDNVVEHFSDDENDENSKGDPGWADAIRKILNSKKPKGKSTIVLSKAKKLPDVAHRILKKNPGFEIDGEIKDEKPDPDELDIKSTKSIWESKIKKKEWDRKGRLKPSILDRDREKTLSKIATKGVVQLFNVVRQQQKNIKTQLQEAKGSTKKRDAVMKSIDKRAFLDILMGSGAKSEVVDNPVKTEPQTEAKEESTTWQVLRDDFMMGAKLKDWDKNNFSNNMDDSESGTGSESDDTTT